MKRKHLIWCVVMTLLLLIAVVCFLPSILFWSSPLPKDLQDRMIHSTSFEALALNHIPIKMLENTMGNTNIGTNILMDYVILGSVQITNLDQRRKLMNAVGYDIDHANHPPSACLLEPRHGIRCKDGTNTILMAICYQCGDVAVQENGIETEYLIKAHLQLPASRDLFEGIFHEVGVKEDSN